MSSLSTVRGGLSNRNTGDSLSTPTGVPDMSGVNMDYEDSIAMPQQDATKSSGGILNKVKSGVGTVAKGAAVVTGVGVLGVMAGTTALAVKTHNKKDECCASFGESMSYYLARLLGGNDHMEVQRLQQAGMKGVEMAVQNKKAVQRAVRPLPTLNMPVPPDNQLSY